jgi:hypothetical protein
MNNNSTDSSPGSLLHVVYFWLKNPDDPSDRAAFEEAIKKLIRTNPQAIASHLGCPAASEKRIVVDNSFTYCYTMTFPNLEAQNTYQNDPTHLLFIEEAQHLWENVRVHDSIAL